MHTMKHFALSLSLSWPLLSGASPLAQDERALREECSAHSGAGMHDCLVGKVRESELALHQAERRVRAALAAWHEDRKYRELAKTQLVRSSQAFAKYREAQCTFAASLGGGAIGNALTMARLACVAELNYRRAEQLCAAAVNLPTPAQRLDCSIATAP
jgi:uncharacterized protein YecT (DUF1311 family)